MRAVVVSSKDLFDKEKNPTLCLSALRAVGKCHKCGMFKRAYKDWREAKLRCAPVIPPEVEKVLKRVRDLRVKARRLSEQLDLLDPFEEDEDGQI